jgi:serine/threonine-protein kinase
MTCPECRAENLEGSESCFHCGASLGGGARTAIKKGTLIAGRYEVRAELGRGGMGTVYQAFDQALEETVALKVLRAEVARSPDMTKRFRSEIKLARRVTHKNVCRIHEYGVDGELNFISMEFVDGVDLKRVLRERGPLEPAAGLKLAIQVCDGLQAIHEVGIVHRDLKTTNLMLDRSNVVKLMDFGIAKQTGVSAEGLTSATHTGHIIGTPEYMSPEQARGEKVDARSDVYAMGIVLFELFTGDVPFRADTPIATILKHIGEPPPLRAAAGRKLPLPLVLVLERALAKAPQDRFQSVVELASALRAVVLEAPVAKAVLQPEPTREATEPMPTTPLPSRPTPAPRTPVPARPTPGTPPPLRSNRPRDTGPPLPRPAPKPEPLRLLPWAAAAVALVGLGTGVAVSLWRMWPTEPSPSPSVEPSLSPSPPVTTTTLAMVTPTTATTTTTLAPPPTTRPTPATTTTTPAPPPTPRPTPAPTMTPEPPPATPTPSVTPAYRPATPRPINWGTPSVSPEPTPSATAPAAREGLLQLLVIPWADVAVDGKSVGTTPLKPLALPAGDHAVRFEHPDYHPLQKRVTIRPGETVRLEVDLTQEGFPKARQ